MLLLIQYEYMDFVWETLFYSPKCAEITLPLRTMLDFHHCLRSGHIQKCLLAIGVQIMHPLWLNTWSLVMLLVVISQNDNQLAKDSDMFVILISKSIFKKFLRSQLILQLIANYVTRNMHMHISDFHLSITYSLLGVGWGAGMAHWRECSLPINVA